MSVEVTLGVGGKLTCCKHHVVNIDLGVPALPSSGLVPALGDGIALDPRDDNAGRHGQIHADDNEPHDGFCPTARDAEQRHAERRLAPDSTKKGERR